MLRGLCVFGQCRINTGGVAAAAYATDPDRALRGPAFRRYTSDILAYININLLQRTFLPLKTLNSFVKLKQSTRHISQQQKQKHPHRL